MIDVRPAEVRALGWSWLYIFAVLCSYYILRPIRDDMGVAGGVDNLQWLFTGTLLGMIAVNPPFAALVAKLPRIRFIAFTYRFFGANLLLFILFLTWRVGRTKHLDRACLLYLGIRFQSIRRVGVLGRDGRCLRHRTE